MKGLVADSTLQAATGYQILDSPLHITVVNDLSRQFGLFSKVNKIDLSRHPRRPGREGGGGDSGRGRDEGGNLWPPKAAEKSDFETDSASDEVFSSEL